MKKVIMCVSVLILFLYAGISVFADLGPKPTLDIVVNGVPEGKYYLDLLSKSDNLTYDKLNSKYSEEYKSMPLYKYNEDGWLATHIREYLLFGTLEGKSDGVTPKYHNFTYFGVPKLFKVIIQLESGELFVSSQKYEFTEFNQVTYINFDKDMIKVAIPTQPNVTSCKINGYIRSELCDKNVMESDFNKDFYVTVDGLYSYATTDKYGHFEINVPKNLSGYKIRIKKQGYLTRAVEIKEVAKDTNLNTINKAIEMWVGDTVKLQNGSYEQDNVINMSDIVNLAVSFNTTSNESGYVAGNDFNNDGVINMADVVIVSKHFNSFYESLSLPGTAPVTITGILVKNTIEGGFYGIIAEDGKYDIGSGEGLTGIENYTNQLVTVTGYILVDSYSAHQWGTGFDAKSIKSANTF